MVNRILAAIAFVVAGSPSAAVTLICNYQISNVSVRPDGYVYMTVAGGQTATWTVCNTASAITVNMSGTGTTTLAAATCQVQYAMFLTAKGTGRTIDFTFLTNGTPTCSNVITAAYANILDPFPWGIVLHD